MSLLKRGSWKILFFFQKWKWKMMQGVGGDLELKNDCKIWGSEGGRSLWNIFKKLNWKIRPFCKYVGKQAACMVQYTGHPKRYLEFLRSTHHACCQLGSGAIQKMGQFGCTRMGLTVWSLSMSISVELSFPKGQHSTTA